MTRIELLKPHTHAGVSRAPGEAIELDADLAAWLIGLGTARAADGASLPTTTTAEAHARRKEKA